MRVTPGNTYDPRRERAIPVVPSRLLALILPQGSAETVECEIPRRGRKIRKRSKKEREQIEFPQKESSRESARARCGARAGARAYIIP